MIFENSGCMILNKPAGLAVQGGKGIGISLDSILANSCKTRPLLVHRLDKDTSGLILIALHREAASVFSALFRSKPGSNDFSKHYLAVVPGIINPDKGVIRLDLDIRGQTKKSLTSYMLVSSHTIQEEFAEEKTIPRSFSLLELELGTGRMHQIRRHLGLIKYPVLGDDKYGDFTLNKELRKTMGLRRLLLHASRLIIPPLPNLLPEGLDLNAPLPDYFRPFVENNDL